MTFYEFLIAKEQHKIAVLLKEPNYQASKIIENKFLEELQQYMLVGGIPECVAEFLEHRKMTNVHNLQDELIYSFSRYFRKYQPTVNDNCLNDVLLNSAKMLGGQITYTKLSDRFSSPTIKKGVDVLTKSRLLYKVPNVSVAGFPLSPKGKRFKLFHLDIGLLIRRSNLKYEESFL